MTGDDLRAKIVQVYKDSKPYLEHYASYCQTQAALAWEYHKVRLTETFPGVELIEDGVTIVLDMRQTPKALDRLLESLKTSATAVRQIRLDRENAKAYLHCK